MFARILRTWPLAAGRVYGSDLFQATLLELMADSPVCTSKRAMKRSKVP